MIWLLIAFVAVLIVGVLFGRAYQQHLDLKSGPWIARKDEGLTPSHLTGDTSTGNTSAGSGSPET
jgi:hypothetical protein